MITSLSACYDDVVASDELAPPDVMTREQIRQAVSAYDPFISKDPCLLHELIRQEITSACSYVQSIGLTVHSDQVKLLVLSSFRSDAGFDVDELNRMSSTTLKRQITTHDVVFSQFIQQLFLHQTQDDIICQRLMNVLAGATANKCKTRAARLHDSLTVTL